MDQQDQAPPPFPGNDSYDRYQRVPPPPPQSFSWGQNVLQSCLVAGCVGGVVSLAVIA